jgi:hypothetical protein
MNEISLLLESELEKKYESHSVLHIKDSQEVRQAGREEGMLTGWQAGREGGMLAGGQ